MGLQLNAALAGGWTLIPDHYAMGPAGCKTIWASLSSANRAPTESVSEDFACFFEKFAIKAGFKRNGAITWPAARTVGPKKICQLKDVGIHRYAVTMLAKETDPNTIC